MKKVMYALAFVCAVSTISCSNDNTEANVQPENKSLKFDSGQQMQDQIVFIENRKAEQESAILQMIQERNGLAAPGNVAGAISGVPRQNDFDAAETLNGSVLFYHQKRLEAIHSLRQELHFTSIQSIADEVNSLKVLDPDAAERLYEQHKSFLQKTEYMVTTVFGGSQGNVVGTNGRVSVNGADLDFVNPDLAARWIRDEDIKQGILAGDSNYRIVWSAGRSVHKDDIGQTFNRSWTQLASLVWYNSTWTLYPSHFFTNSGSTAYFFQGLSTWTLGFPVGSGSYLRNESASQPSPYWTGNGSVSGSYWAPVGGSYWILNGSITYP